MRDLKEIMGILGNLALQEPPENQDLQEDRDAGVTWVLLGKRGGRA